MEKRKLLLGGLALLVFAGLAAVLLWPDNHAVRPFAVKQHLPAGSARASQPCALKKLAGDWLLFIHYDDSTLTAELTVDRQGRTCRASRKIAENLKFSFDADGNLLLVNQSLRLKGRYDPAAGYLSGTAVSGWPVPFAARHITEVP